MKINNHYKKTLNTDKNIFDVLIGNISSNKNMNDPVLSTIDISGDTLSGDTLSGKYSFLNHKINKYINNLHKYYEKIELKTNLNRFEIMKIKSNGFTCLYLKDFIEETTVIIFDNLYRKVKKRYYENKINQKHNHKEYRDYLIWGTFFRYQYFNIGCQCASYENVMLESRDKLKIDVELFSSLINTTLKYFCSLFHDLEKYFGSVGNFFNFEPVKGFYEIGAPYEETIIIKTLDRIMHFLKNYPNFSALIFTPVWRIKDRELLNKYCTKKYKIGTPNDFDVAVDTLKNSEYVLVDRLYCAGDYNYYCYNKMNSQLSLLPNNVIIVSNEFEFVDSSFLPSKFISLTNEKKY